LKTILVSGASGIVGYGVLRSLRGAGIDLKLIGTTIYENSIAEVFSDVFEKAPLTSSEGYISWLKNTIAKHQVDLIIPCIEADLYKWADHLEEIESACTKVLINNPSLIQVCRDKWKFYEDIRPLNAELTIESTLESDFTSLTQKFGLPFLLKPRQGFASKGIVRVTDETVFNQYQEQIGSVLMVQPIVGTDDDEYTTSAFCDGSGSFFAHLTLRRKLSKEGFTDKAEVVWPDELDEPLHVLCAHFKPIGPTNFQFRKHNGVYKLLEINPRISSSTSIRTSFGYNESAMAVNYFLDKTAPSQPKIKQGKAIRYIEDFIIEK